MSLFSPHLHSYILFILIFFCCSSFVFGSYPPVVGSFGDPLKWCPTTAPTKSPPTSIDSLHPSDVQVIAAIGDSITAGFGIDGFWGSLTENRGKSWAIGGAADAPTLANFFKRYNPNIQGASLGSHWVEVCADFYCPSAHRPDIDQLNAAQSGAWAQNLPDQVSWLIQQMHNNSKIDFNNDWKVITLLIGANNLCAACIVELDPIDSADDFEQSIKDTFVQLAKIPRAFINVVQLFNISSVYRISEPYPYCADLHTVAQLECECDFSGDDGAANRAKLDVMAGLFRDRMAKVVESLPRRRDWAAVLQPVLANGTVPNIDYLSDLDCFHPSAYGHRSLAIGVWNSMLLPKSQKPNYWNSEMLFPLCPDNNSTLRID